LKYIPVAVISFILVFSVSALSVELDDFSVNATIYPEKLPDKTNNGWLVNDREWLSFSVDFTVNIYKGLYTRFDTETFIFGTNGFNFAPSSTKFISEIGYKFDRISIRYRHFCHHYFHQFQDRGNQQDKLIFEYSF